MAKTDTPIVKWTGFDDANRTKRQHKANAAFIAAAHNDAPAIIRDLLAERDALREQVARLEGRVCLICGRSEPCAEVPEACTFDPSPIEAAKRFQAEARQQRARAERAEAALEPFAGLLMGHWFHSHQPDTLPISFGFGAYDLRWYVPLGAFRRARAIFEPAKGDDQ